MRLVSISLFCMLLFGCQKEVSTSGNQIIASTFDSVLGRWAYKYDYRLVTTQADTTTVIDSVFSGRYDPFSYFEIKADSTFKWWRSASQSLPMYGGGEGGHLIMNPSLRTMKLTGEFSTNDDFGSNTWPITPPSTGPNYRIKYLSNDSMVLSFRVIGPASTYWWWHDVFVK